MDPLSLVNRQNVIRLENGTMGPEEAEEPSEPEQNQVEHGWSYNRRLAAGSRYVIHFRIGRVLAKDNHHRRYFLIRKHLLLVQYSDGFQAVSLVLTATKKGSWKQGSSCVG
jgi:hypothetical protein